MHHVNIPFRIQFPQVICWLVVASFSSCCPWRKLGGDGVHPLEGDPRSETAIEIMGNMWGKWWLTINMLAFFPTCSDKPGFVTSLGHNLKKSCPGLCNNDGKMGVPPPPKKKKQKGNFMGNKYVLHPEILVFSQHFQMLLKENNSWFTTGNIQGNLGVAEVVTPSD